MPASAKWYQGREKPDWCEMWDIREKKKMVGGIQFPTPLILTPPKPDNYLQEQPL